VRQRGGRVCHRAVREQAGLCSRDAGARAEPAQAWRAVSPAAQGLAAVVFVVYALVVLWAAFRPPK